MANCEYVAETYNVPACIGRRIKYKDREGIISCDRGNYIGVTFDNEKPTEVSNIHPTDENLEYLEMGKVRQMTPSQKRYQKYLDSECNETFAEWLGIYQ